LIHNFTHDLVTGNDLMAPLRKLSFHDMQIGSADPARAHMQQNLSW
jgi:hypothetical protein